MSKALEQYFRFAQGQEEIISEIHLDRNGLKDSGLANLLRGIAQGAGNRHIQKLSIYNNEIGPESLEVLREYYLEYVSCLSLGNVKIAPEIRAKLMSHIREYTF
jgi:hypothetical protein